MYKFFVEAGLVLFSAFAPNNLPFFLTLSFSIVLCLLALQHPNLYSFFLMSLLSIYVVGRTYLHRAGFVI